MQKRFESVIAIGRKIGLNDETGYAVAIFLALLIVSATVIGYYAVLAPPAEPYDTIYLLDANKKAVDYPDILVGNQNSTFNVYVNVENHLGNTTSYQVQVKITKNLSTFPINDNASQVYEIKDLENGKNWKNMATITQTEVGSYSVAFELWQYKANILEFTHNYCVLKIQVIN